MGEEDDEYCALLLQVAELKSELSGMLTHNHFERRMAERETETLERYLEEKLRCVEKFQDLQQRQLSHTERALTLPMINTLSDGLVGFHKPFCPVFCAAAHDARVVATLLSLVNLTEKYKFQQAQALKCHHLLHDLALCSSENGTDSLVRVKKLSTRLLQSIKGSYQPAHISAEPQRGLRTQSDNDTRAVLAKDEHFHVLKSFVYAFQHLQCSSLERQEALRGLLEELSCLSTCRNELYEFCSRQAVKDAAIKQELDVLFLPTQEWGLMASQAMLWDDQKYLSISAALTTRPPITRNKRLKWYLKELQTALTTLIVAHAMELECKDPKSINMSNAAAAADEAEKEEARLEKLHENLTLEVMFLRRKLREMGDLRYWQHALNDSTRSESQDNHVPVNETLGIIGGLLLSEYHKKLEALFFSSSPEGNGVASGSLPPAFSNPDGSIVSSERDSMPCTCGSPDLNQSMQLLLLHEQVESHQQSLSSLLAANVRLIQSIGNVRMIYRFATDPEKAESLVNALLTRCGYGFSSQDDPSGDEENLNFTSFSSSSLTDLQERVLETHRQRLEALQAEANACLERLQNEVHQPHLYCRVNLSFILRIQYLSDLRRLTTVAGMHSAAFLSSGEGIPQLLGRLESNGIQLPSCPPVEGEYNDELSIPALPIGTRSLQEEFRTLYNRKVDCQKESWTTNLREYASSREELEWYEQFTMEEIPDALEEAKKVQNQLKHDITAVQQSRKQQLLKREKASQLDKAFEEILVHQRNPLRARVDELRVKLQRLQEEKEASMAKTDLQATPDVFPDMGDAVHSCPEVE
ncbi:unnamed protein product [Phytomonas sp. Hart1]|nr:unnamed protein product [Phytomonas sp. Hart1]|eukprot:CCW67314.1 unnamed protein product [Phytomonas sp. isolate Hart1]